MSQVKNALPAQLRVAYVIHSMNIGGAERNVTRLINKLDPRQFLPILVCLTKSGPAVEWITRDGIEVIEIGKNRGRDPGATHRLADTLRKFKVDLVHSHNWGTLLESCSAVRKSRIPIHVHAERGTVLGKIDKSGWRLKARGIAAGFALRKCDAVVSNSTAVAKRIAERCFFPEDKVQIISNGIEELAVNHDAEHVADVRRSFGIPADALVLGGVGRLVPVKGFDVAIRALAECTITRAHLLLVGDGPERTQLTDLAESLCVADRVHFAGHHEDVQNWLGVFDVFINSSHSEGMSQSIVEAMSARLPIVATDVGDSGVLISSKDNKCGILVPPNAPQAIADAVEQLKNDSTRKHLGKLAQRRQQQFFGISRMTTQYEDLYRRLACP